MSQRIVLATTAGVPNREIKEVVDIVSAEVAVGMNIFKDLFSAVRDVVGGRAGAVQDTLKDFKEKGLKVHILPRWNDIDTCEDLKNLMVRNKAGDSRYSHTINYLSKNGGLLK